MTEDASAREVRRDQGDSLMHDTCPAVLMIKGVAYPCDWNMRNMSTGTHDGWAHTSVNAQAIWCGDEGNERKPVKQVRYISSDGGSSSG